MELSRRWRQGLGGIPAVGVVVAVTFALLIAPPGQAKERPTCFGHRATIVGMNHHDHISGTPHRDVIVAKAGNDVIKTPKGPDNAGRDVICTGSGDDYVKGDTDSEK